jgi:uncharacterized repeat protein (TIGR01451 family)
MSKTFFKLGLGLLAAAGMMCPAGVQAANKTLHGHVPAAVSQLVPKGQMAATNNLQLAIGLPMHDQAGLNTLIQQISDPASPNYHKYITTEEFTERFGPTKEDYQKAIDFAQSNGLKVTGKHANRMVLEVNGRASDVEHAFGVTLRTYKHPTENRDFFSADTEPVVPEGTPILDISGLNNYSRPHPRLVVKPVSQVTNTPHAGSGQFGTYLGYDFRNAYVPGTTLNGAGQKVALLQFDGYTASDIATYAQIAGLPSVSLTNILLGGFSGIPTFSGGEVEVSLDIEMVMCMAPSIDQILVYEGDPFSTAPNTILSRIANDNAARQVSCSWGWGGGPDATTEQIFQQMIVQGQTFFNASGDSDAFLPGQVDNPGYPGSPSSSPNITQVGGTTLSTTGPNGARVSEQVWNVGFNSGAGSCGGISSFYGIPSWQQGFANSTNQGSSTFRNIPDVALTADNVFVYVDGGGLPGVGGTSVAAPLWAGFTALVNQQGVLNGKPSVGFINPAVYAIARTATYNSVFNDITNGNNTWFQSPTSFYAVTNYDLCTGLGTPNGTNFINALVGNSSSSSSTLGPIISAPRAPWGSTLGSLNGGNPNGLWFLFVQDDTINNTGAISNGWSVTLTSANPVGYASDNQMFASPAVTPVSIGGNWVVKVAVTNYGPSISTNVVVTDTMPIGAGLSYVSGVPTTGSVMQFGSTLSWSLGNLASGAGACLNLTFNATVAGTYSNGVSVASSVVDPNPDDDTAGAVANVRGDSPAGVVGRGRAGWRQIQIPCG